MVEKRDVDVDDAEDEIDEEFDPIINKGFCKFNLSLFCFVHLFHKK